jgi:transcriptional regulator with XRE-family HTH domain
MAKSEWVLFLREVSGRASGRQISRETGVPEATISRWLSGTTAPQPRQATTVARTYDASAISALIAAGHLTQDDVDIDVAAPRWIQLRDFSSLELAEELQRRAAAGEFD